MEIVYTTDEINQLTLIAQTCVHTGGNGVLMARNILDQLMPDTTTLYGDRYNDSLYCAYNNNFRIRNTQLKQEKASKTITSNEIKWTVLPNPAQNKVSIVLNIAIDSKLKVELLPINGSQVIQTNFVEAGNTKLSIDISGVANGIYIVKLTYADKRVAYKKLTIINH